MKTLIGAAILVGLASAPSESGATPSRAAPMSPGAERIAARLLPEDFTVYVRGTIVVNHPVPGFEPRRLPTANVYQGEPGCYMACYSHVAQGAVYSVGGDIYVMGQVRVPGQYEGRICRPTGASSSASQIAALCGRWISTCGDRCWGGGDTGGWFGIQ